MLSSDNQAFLCAMLNSYVANYLVRQVMTTHLGSATVEALRVPKPPYDSPLFEQIVEWSHELRRGTRIAHARVQALAARCYGLTEDEFSHVLGTFPLVDAGATPHSKNFAARHFGLGYRLFTSERSHGPGIDDRQRQGAQGAPSSRACFSSISFASSFG